MGATTQKVYQLSIELGESQQRLADAGKLLADLKTKAAAANQEAKETKEIYLENAKALKELAQQGKALEVAKGKAAAGGDAAAAAAAVTRNATEQKKLNTIVQESKVVYDDAKQAAVAAGAAVGKQAVDVKQLAGGVKDYQAAAKAASQEFAPGTVGALRQEVIALEAALENGAVGSAELGTAIQQLGDKKSQLRELGNAVNAANPRAQARAFTVFTGALTGCVGVAGTAAQAFGLSSQTAEQWTQKMQGLTGVLLSVEQFSKALNGENVALLKSVGAGIKGWLGFGDAAAAGSKAARVGLASTGIGLLVLAVGALIALFMDWGSQVKGSESTFTKYKATVVGVFDGLLALVKDYYKILFQVFTLDWSGAAATFKKGGADIGKAFAEGRAGVIDEARRKELAQEAEMTDRLLDILRARGTDTLALEVENAKRKLNAQKNGSKEQLDAARDYDVLRDQLEKRNQDEQKAGRLAFLNGLASAEAARGADTFAQQLKAKKAEQAQLYQALAQGQYITAAQLEQVQNELDELSIAHDKQLADKRRALRMARLEGELAITEAAGREQLTYLGTEAQDELALGLRTNAQKLRIATQVGQDLRAQAQVDWAAVKANETEQYTLGIERARLYAQQQVQVVVEGIKLRQKVQAAILDSADRRASLATLLTVDPNAAGLAKRSLERLTQGQIAVISNEMEKAAKQDVFGNLFIKLFGLTDAQAQDLKGRISEFAEQTGALATTLITIGQDAADQRLQETQATLQTVTDQLSQAQAAANDTASQLESATGAKRDYLIKKLQAQRTEEERLAAAKAKATAAELAAEREKQKLTKEGTQLTLAAGIASTIASGQKAVLAAVDIISGAASVPFPANIFAIGAGLAVVVSALAQARSLSKTFANGGLVDGPSHGQGGIQMWHKGGAHLGEMEGGEFVVNRAATTKNRALLEMINEAGRTRVLPPPPGHFAAGGMVTLPGGASASGGQVMVQAADLSELIATNRQMAAHLQGINQSNQQIASYGPAKLSIGPYEAQQIEQEKQKGEQAQGFATL